MDENAEFFLGDEGCVAGEGTGISYRRVLKGHRGLHADKDYQ